jgi:hypothetical protein
MLFVVPHDFFPDNLLYRPVLYCLVLTTALERHVCGSETSGETPH